MCVSRASTGLCGGQPATAVPTATVETLRCRVANGASGDDEGDRASKKKNDRIDARKTAGRVRCNLLPACYVAPVEIRELLGCTTAT